MSEKHTWEEWHIELHEFSLNFIGQYNSTLTFTELYKLQRSLLISSPIFAFVIYLPSNSIIRFIKFSTTFWE